MQNYKIAKHSIVNVHQIVFIPSAWLIFHHEETPADTNRWHIFCAW